MGSFGNFSVDWTVELADNNGNCENLTIVQAPTEAGVITKLVYWGKIFSGTPKCRAIVYTNSGSNKPDVLLGVGDEVAPPVAEGYFNLTGLNVHFSANQMLWIGFMDDGNGNIENRYRTVVAAMAFVSGGFTYPTPIAVMVPANVSLYDEQQSVYAEYIPDIATGTFLF